VKAAAYPSESAPQPDAAQWRMLRAIAAEAIAAAREHGAETIVFGGYRVAARRVVVDGGTVIELTLSRAPSDREARAATVRTEVAGFANPETASVIAWRCPYGCNVRSKVPPVG
jgi:hypothetical protein